MVHILVTMERYVRYERSERSNCRLSKHSNRGSTLSWREVDALGVERGIGGLKEIG